MTLAAVMLGSAAVSAGCCAASRTGASLPARILAGVMLAVMAAAALDAAPVVQGAGALALLAMAGLLVGGTTGRDREVAGHRAAGAVLMALAVLLPPHDGSMEQLAIGASMSHGAAGHGAETSVLVLALRAATGAYLCWVAAALVRRRDRPITDLLRWEHLAMGASLTAMVFFMS